MNFCVSKLLFLSFLIGTAVATITNDWYRANDTVWVLKDEILHIHQAETIQRDVKCQKVYTKSYYSMFAPPMILEELRCDDESYQPPTLEEAIEILAKIPNSDKLYLQKLKLQRYSEKIPIEMQQIITSLWNKIEEVNSNVIKASQNRFWMLTESKEVFNVTWDQIIDQIQE